jgi:hypothetical protein
MTNKNVVTLEDAKSYVKLWRKEFPEQVKAILIPNEDLIELLGLEQGQGNGYDIRCYIGINPDDLKDSPKLLIVRVDAEGKDLINDTSGISANDNGNDIYDLTKPCPQFCDETSPLFNP